MHDLSGKTYFVTGASGYIGRQLVPALLAAGATARCLTRAAAPTRSQPIARHESIVGDLHAPETYRATLRGCDAVIHCAKSDDPDEQTRANRDIDATRVLLRQSVDSGVRRFVQLSSISVYAVTPSGTIDERSAKSLSTNPYIRSKIAIEQVVCDSATKIESVILQPANVYGRTGGWWSGALLEMMKRGRVLLVNRGDGMANMVHVDDVVRAVLLSLNAASAAGECFLISDGQPVPWRDYFHKLELLTGRAATVSVTATEAKRLSHKLNDRSPLARAVRWSRRRFLGQPIIFPLTDVSIDKFASKAVFCIERARRTLNYEPSITLDSGMATVRA